MADISFNRVDNDIEIKGGDFVFTSDKSFVETMKQRITAYLYTFLGEYFLDSPSNPQIGVPYLQSLFSQKLPTLEIADAIFRNALLNIPDITAIETLEFEYNRTTRLLDVSFRVKIKNNGEYVEDIINLSIG